MKITVIGATGMIGSRIVAEAVQRGHEVTAASRSGAMAKGASRATAMELSDTSAVSAAIDASDATVIAVSPDRSGGSHEPTIRAHRNLVAAQPSGRFLVVGGAGSLEIDGVRLKDTAGFPPAYYNEAATFSTILDLYRSSRGLDWTMLSPAPMIAPGQRTGVYRVGSDSPIGDAISAEDFAVAIVDELEKPAHTGTRFTVANQRGYSDDPPQIRISWPVIAAASGDETSRQLENGKVVEHWDVLQEVPETAENQNTMF